MKFALATPSFFILVLFVGSACAQTPTCTDSTIAKISSRGIKIGESMNDLLSLFASTDEDKNKIRPNYSGPNQRSIGFEVFSAGTAGVSQPDRFDGISGYIFYVLDDKLAGFSVTYTKPKWENPNQFIDKMAGFFDLPKADQWKGDTIRQLQCENYSLHAQLLGSGAIFTVTDARLASILKDRQQAADREQREKDSKVFKP